MSKREGKRECIVDVTPDIGVEDEAHRQVRVASFHAATVPLRWRVALRRFVVPAELSPGLLRPEQRNEARLTLEDLIHLAFHPRRLDLAVHPASAPHDEEQRD